MPLTRWERKAALKYGAMKSIAKRCRRSQSHVSMVISGARRDAVVEKEVARRLKMSVEEAFGPLVIDEAPTEEIEHEHIEVATSSAA